MPICNINLILFFQHLLQHCLFQYREIIGKVMSKGMVALNMCL